MIGHARRFRPLPAPGLDGRAPQEITITLASRDGLANRHAAGLWLRVEVPAGEIDVRYKKESANVTAMKIRNVPSYVAATGIAIDVPGFGPLTVDVAYGGNYYAIVEPQGSYKGLDSLGAARILELSPLVRSAVREKFEPVYPVEPTIRGVSHVLWADAPKGEGADGRNAVFYGERAIDRSPCGTGTSARLAHLAAKGKLKVGDSFVHESYIGSRFTGRVESAAKVGNHDAIVPSIEGSAIATGYNTIFIDPADVFWRGFQVK
jgi:4-hydroxyproline epimerase